MIVGGRCVSGDADLREKVIQAVYHYRDALAKVEELEKEEAHAQQTLTELLRHVEVAIVDRHASLARHDLYEAGQAAISRLSGVRRALSAATAALDETYRTLVALDQALGRIPISQTPGGDQRDHRNNSRD
jgi:paraquat-inducible protein B